MDLQNDNRTPRDRVDDDFRRFLTDEGDGSFADDLPEAVPAFAPSEHPRDRGVPSAAVTDARPCGCPVPEADPCPCAPSRTAPRIVRHTNVTDTRGDTAPCGCGSPTSRAVSTTCGCAAPAPRVAPTPCGCASPAPVNAVPAFRGYPCGRIAPSRRTHAGRSFDPAPLPPRIGCTGLSPERGEMLAALGCTPPLCTAGPVPDLDSAFPLSMVYSPVQTFGGIMESRRALAEGTVFTDLDLPFGHAKLRKGAVR